MEHPNVQLSVLNMTSYTKTTSSELHELHDSGIDCEEAPFELPDKQMIQRIVQQVCLIFKIELFQKSYQLFFLLILG